MSDYGVTGQGDRVPVPQVSSRSIFSSRPDIRGARPFPDPREQVLSGLGLSRAAGSTAVGETWGIFSLAPFEQGGTSGSGSRGPLPWHLCATASACPPQMEAAQVPLASDSASLPLLQTRTVPGDIQSTSPEVRLSRGTGESGHGHKQ